MSIVLLRGPAENVIPIDCLGDNIPNTGTFSWTPATSLEADVTGYGLQIIVTGTGQFQYSTQFGISNANPTAPKPSASASASGSISQPHGASAATKQPDAHATDSRVHLPTTAATLQPEGKIHTPAIHVKSNATTSAEHAPYSTSSRASLPSSSHVVEAPIRSNATVVAPSKSVHGPVVSLQTSLSVKYPSGPATGTVAGTGSVPSATNVFTGDAGRMFTQGGIVGLFSIVVAALL